MDFYLRQAAAWILFAIGDLISNTLLRVGWGYGAYNWVMLLSSDLDREGVVWKDAPKDDVAKAGEYLSAKKTFSRDPLDFLDKDQDAIDDRADIIDQ